MTESRLIARLDDRYSVLEGEAFLTGIQALVRLPLDVRRYDQRASRRTALFISGYEGSPLGGYDLELVKRRELLREHDVVFQPGLNEELAATSVQGTQFTPTMESRLFEGVVGFWYGKSPGLDRAVDALRHANLAGTHHLGGAVAIVGDDPAAKSSTVPGCSERILADLGIPTLYPADPQDVLDFGLHAVTMSRLSGLWAGLKIATNVADGAATVQVNPDRVVPIVPDLEIDGRPFIHTVTGLLLQPRLTALERSRNGPRLEIARRYAAANGLDVLVRSSADDRVGIVAAGKTFLDVQRAFAELGLTEAELTRRGVRVLKLAMVHPLEPGVLRRFADGLQDIIVIEEKRSFIESEIKDQLYGAGAPRIYGKRGPDGLVLVPSEGELGPEVIADVLASWLPTFGDFPSVTTWVARRRLERKAGRTQLPIVSRTPYFCSGCPHNSSLKTPEGSLVGGGIGCHSLALFMGPEQVGDITGLTQMGGEGAQWIGIAPFVSTKHLFQNIGDGTFHHSGSLAMRAAIASGVNVTYKLLYNSAVAMTGGQQIVGSLTVAAITRLLSAEGVRHIIVTTEDSRRYERSGLAPGVEVWDRSRIIEAQEKLAGIPGVTLLIHDQECATELRRKRTRGVVEQRTKRVFINERICEGCGDCGRKSNCLSVHPVDTEFGRKTQIDQGSCNTDYTCLEGDCPSFLSVRPGKVAARLGAAEIRPQEPLPLPTTTALQKPFVIRILGVGGSGVVTASQILGTAATIAGRHVLVLDQTGLAQKGGAVVSDVKFGDQALLTSNRSAFEECDLYIGVDVLVAADPRNLAVASAERTHAVVSTAVIPTGRMVVDVSEAFPELEHVKRQIQDAVRSDSAVFFDARLLTQELLGNSQLANVVLLGVAFQRGWLPLPLEAIEQALSLNGTQVQANLNAFTAGRRFAADPSSYQSQLATTSTNCVTRAATVEELKLIESVGAPIDSELARLVKLRVLELVDYQNIRYARRYAAQVASVRRIEVERLGGRAELSEAVATYLFKVMAYKDEYEVARLALDPEMRAAVRRQFGEGARVSYRLQPPFLRALGVQKKLSLGSWFEPTLWVLARLRGLRGKWCDPFGHTEVRRTERKLMAEYSTTIDHVLELVNDHNLDAAVAIAQLPDGVRGYEEIKLRSVERYRNDVSNQLRKLAEGVG